MSVMMLNAGLRGAMRAPHVGAVAARAWPRTVMPAFSLRCMGTFYTKEHEWVRPDGDTASVGISTHAAAQLGDIVYVELPDVGTEFEKGDSFGVAESVKAASDVYSPVGGEVTEVNETLSSEPNLINASAEDEGWMMKVKLADPSSATEGLMDEAAYANYCEADDH